MDDDDLQLEARLAEADAAADRLDRAVDQYARALLSSDDDLRALHATHPQDALREAIGRASSLLASAPIAGDASASAPANAPASAAVRSSRVDEDAVARRAASLAQEHPELRGKKWTPGGLSSHAQLMARARAQLAGESGAT